MTEGKAIQYVTVSVATAGDNEILAAPANATERYRLLAFALSNNSDTATDVKWRSAATDITGALDIAVGALVQAEYSPVGHCVTQPGEALNLNLADTPTAGAISGWAVVELY